MAASRCPHVLLGDVELGVFANDWMTKHLASTVQGSNIVDAIGLEETLQGIIGKVVDKYMLWPNRIIVPLSRAVDRKKLESKVYTLASMAWMLCVAADVAIGVICLGRYQGQGILYVHVVGVEELLNEFVIKRTNPYVTLSLDRYPTIRLSSAQHLQQHESRLFVHLRIP